MLKAVENSGAISGPLKLIDDPNVIEFFADELCGVTHVNGNCALVFASVKADHSQVPPRNYRKPSGGVRTTLPGLLGMHAMLGQMIDQLKKQGVVMPPVTPAPTLYPVQ